MSKYVIQRQVCFIRGKFKCSLKEAWSILAKVDNAKKQAQNAKSVIKENSKQLKIQL